MNETYIPNPVDTSDVCLPEELQPLSEALAQNTHDTWACARMKEGWTWGPARDDRLRKHPDLVPYEDLPDTEKEYDRLTSAETLKFIIKLGYKILNHCV